MAQKRMFSKEVVRSDEFLDLPATSQLLYFHFGMIADDDGIVASVDRELRYLGVGSKDDLKIMIDKGFIAVTSDGKLIFITDWLKNNNLRNDRYNRTNFAEARLELESQGYKFKSKNFGIPTGIPTDTEGISMNGSSDEEPSKNKGLEHGIPDVNQSATPDKEQDKDKDLGKGLGKVKNKDKEESQTDSDSLFIKYFSNFLNLSKKNIQRRALTLQEFIKLTSFEREQAAKASKVYHDWYLNTGNDVKYSVNSYEFILNAMFKEFQEMPEDKSGYDPELGF
ncbi:phage replisome organizer protein [Lactococcus lactis]|uniref:phage replisome organizer protein n=1 Tax=Lactococcus lactis TaxID=1358 RepID=UPI001C1F366D|nr:phage replisome organiser protein [Lactococcus lactis]MBU7531126.1 phage replisome organizer protein [Lactococcus lactis]